MYLTELARRREWKTLITEANTLAQNFENPDYPSSEILCQHSLPVLKNLAQNRKWVEFIRAVNHLSEHIKISRQKLILDYAVKPLVPGFISKFLRAFSKGKQSSRKGLPFINPVFAQRINLEERKQSLKRFSNQPTTDREKQWRSLTSGLLTIPIETVDLISSPFKIEPRFPFMDKRLIEFCLSLPPEQKLNQGWSRIVLRRAMEGILPAKVQWRGGKTTPAAAFLHGLMKFDKEFLSEIFSQEATKIEEYINLNTLEKAYHLFISNKLREADQGKIWSAITLMVWFRYHKSINN